MSLILDALNRSRDEANPVPGLATHHPMAMVSAERRQYLLWMALAVSVVVIAWLMMEKYSPSPSSITPTLQQEIERKVVAEEAATAGSVPGEQGMQGSSVQASAQVPVVTPVAQSAEPLPEPLTLESAETSLTSEQVGSASVAVASVYESAEPAPTSVSAAEAFFTDDANVFQEEQSIAGAPSPAGNDAVAQLYQNPALLDDPVPANPARQRSAVNTGDRADAETAREKASGEPIDLDKILRMAREEVENASLDEHSVPFLIDLSQQIKDSIPTVHYLRHDYSSDTAQSSVVLNSKTLKVGDSPAQGMKVEEILPDSVVLNYQGTQFRLRALNSWINL